MFYLCTSTGPGGSIYFNCNLGILFMSFICGANCYITGSSAYGQFSHIKTSSNNSISLIYNSIIKSSPNSTNSNGPIYFEYGNISLFNVNSSSNICYRHAGSSIRNHRYIINKYCTFSLNTALDF